VEYTEWVCLGPKRYVREAGGSGYAPARGWPEKGAVCVREPRGSQPLADAPDIWVEDDFRGGGRGRAYRTRARRQWVGSAAFGRAGDNSEVFLRLHAQPVESCAPEGCKSADAPARPAAAAAPRSARGV